MTKRTYSTALLRNRLHIEFLIADELWYNTLASGDRITYVVGMHRTQRDDLRIWSLTVGPLMLKLGWA